ncbi:glycoside hydrolase family 43 protein [Zasmidium cellare ATCC 36951]|uniref:Glycoside hydrolase family 43 protein n=1 Tax=Zasmidium cellare ATCC 36951 TaxID=1080233 RepID=A0A6A6CFU2_ZASCE|nr:glycoside hydrolase family 43 protein [Zasmidium cellare ATCC 36951]KAF2165110.1 glycoside hydrolase family 43 protein [Zasmidium cellare ATCC 36951]
MLSLLAKTASVFALLLNTINAAPLEKRATDLKPVITTDFPDPTIIKVGNTWYAFASQSAYDYKDIKVQLATSTDFNTWTVTGKDALGSMAPWVKTDGPAVWAPSVSQRADGSFLMYYSAVTNTAGNGAYHCVGTATSDSVEGPYNSNSDEPFACPIDQGGALDASAFIDTDGTNYALYKVDANSKGHGGVCGNTVEPIVKTPIMIQKVQADGTTKIGDPVELIHNTDRDGPLVEAPYMIRNSDGVYMLFFSSNCYTSADYDVSYATSSSPTGPFAKTTTPLFVTGVLGTIGPGGASVASDGTSMVLHGYENDQKVGNVRSMFVVSIAPQGQKVLLQQ